MKKFWIITAVLLLVVAMCACKQDSGIQEPETTLAPQTTAPAAPTEGPEETDPFQGEPEVDFSDFATEPDATQPTETEPQVTEPTEPPETEPKPTEPTPTQPKPTEPEETQPEATDPEEPVVPATEPDGYSSQIVRP